MLDLVNYPCIKRTEIIEKKCSISFRRDKFINKITSIKRREKERRFVHGSKRFTIKEKKRKR